MHTTHTVVTLDSLIIMISDQSQVNFDLLLKKGVTKTNLYNPIPILEFF